MTKSAAPKRHLPTSPFKVPVAPAPKHFDTGDQVTRYQFGVTLAHSDLASNEFLRAEVYPDSVGGTLGRRARGEFDD